MRIRSWDDILSEVAESDADSAAWRAIGGDRRGGIGEDLYLAHPGVGAYQVKTYAKNPFEVQGVGAKIARQVDEEIDPLFPDQDSDGLFGIQQPPDGEDSARRQLEDLETVVETHADAPTTPRAMLEDVLDALDSPAYGPMTFDDTGRPDRLEDLTATFESAESVLDAEFEDIIEEDVRRGFY